MCWVVGKSAPSFYYNMVGDRDRAPQYAQVLLRTAPPEATARLVPELQSRLGEAFPQARIIVRDLVQGPLPRLSAEMLEASSPKPRRRRRVAASA